MSQTEKKFTHLNQEEQPRMVDVSNKIVTHRTAIAEALIQLGPELAKMLEVTGSTKKGPAIQTAVIAGIQGTKKTSDIIPMCHPLPLSAVEVDIRLEGEKARIQVKVKTSHQTGVEMEALTGASIAALTLYDMCKSVSKEMIIESIKLLKKTGGKSGDYTAESY
jgi:cyclic pyranopterin monophosphate synthase